MADEAGVPSEKEIRQLPRWARVAFAARCARRVQPLFKAAWPDAPKEHVQAIEKAIALAEQSAAARAAAVRRDFDKLTEAATRENWTDKTGVPAEFFGPLWLEGEEPDWADVARELGARRREPKGVGGWAQGEKVIVQSFVGESVDDETLVESMIELYQALNRYDVLCGGSGLTIDDWQMFVRAGEPVEELV